MVSYDGVDVAVDGKHGDQRCEDAAEEVEVDHKSHVDDGDERTRRPVNELVDFTCQAKRSDLYRFTCVYIGSIGVIEMNTKPRPYVVRLPQVNNE